MGGWRGARVVGERTGQGLSLYHTFITVITPSYSDVIDDVMTSFMMHAFLFVHLTKTLKSNRAV